MEQSKKDEKNTDSYDYLANAASTTDCTGLIPTPAYTEEQRESYDDIYHFKATPVIPQKKES